MDLQTYTRAIRNSWWLVLLAALLGGGAGVAVTERATPVYQSEVTFFVSTPSDAAGSPLQADQYVQARINSYLMVMTTEKFAQRVLDKSGVDVSVAGVQSSISAGTELDSVVINATISNSAPDRSLALAAAVATEFDPFVQALDTRDKDGKAPVTLRVVSGPTLNPNPVSPRPSLNIGLGVLVGLLLGIGIAVLRQRTDASVDSLDALREVSGLPVLGSAAYDKSVRQAPILVGDQLMRSLRAESYRQLRTGIQFVGVDNPAQVIVVASAVDGEGRTTTAANLAVVHAESGQKVLLIEGDMRRPTLAKYLGLQGTVGLSDVLAGRMPVSQALQPWSAAGVTVLSAGTVPTNPSELLGSDLMLSVIQDLRSEFEVIIVDVPPVLPVTDAVVASTWADGVLLVVRYGRTSREDVSDALLSLASVDAFVLGSMLNMRPARGGDAVGGYNDVYYDDESDTGAAPQRKARSSR